MAAYIRASCDDCGHEFNATTTSGTLAQIATRLAISATCPECRSGKTRICEEGGAQFAPLDDLVEGILDKIFACFDDPETKRAGKTRAGYARLLNISRSQITLIKLRQRRISLHEIRIAEDYLGIQLLPPALQRLVDGEPTAGKAA